MTGRRSCDDPDLLKAINTIVAKRRAGIITNSWGEIGEDVPPATLRAYAATFVQAANEGIGVFFSSGDDGDDSADTANGSPAVDVPASHPLVTAVGGTALGVTKNKGYGFETGWTTGTSTLTGSSWQPPYPGDWLYGGGGGVSALFAEPSYQAGVVPNAVANWPPRGPRHRDGRRPADGHAGGRDADVPRPERQVLRVPHRRDEPLLAAVRGRGGAGRPGRRPPARLRQPGDLPPDGSVLHDIKGPSPYPAVVRVNYNNSVDDSEGLTTLLRSLDDEAQSIHLAPGWDTITGVGSPNGAGYVLGLGARGGR